MKKSIKLTIILLLAALTHIVHAGEYTDSERRFMLNGKIVILSDELMDQLRGMWVWPDAGTALRVNSLFNPSDVQWMLDYIAINEMLNSDNCKKIEFLETRKFVPEMDDKIKAYTGEIGLFDYLWLVNSCGDVHGYRVFNAKGEKDVTVVPASL